MSIECTCDEKTAYYVASCSMHKKMVGILADLYTPCVVASSEFDIVCQYNSLHVALENARETYAPTRLMCSDDVQKKIFRRSFTKNFCPNIIYNVGKSDAICMLKEFYKAELENTGDGKYDDIMCDTMSYSTAAYTFPIELTSVENLAEKMICNDRKVVRGRIFVAQQKEKLKYGDTKFDLSVKADKFELSFGEKLLMSGNEKDYKGFLYSRDLEINDRLVHYRVCSEDNVSIMFALIDMGNIDELRIISDNINTKKIQYKTNARTMYENYDILLEGFDGYVVANTTKYYLTNSTPFDISMIQLVVQHYDRHSVWPINEIPDDRNDIIMRHLYTSFCNHYQPKYVPVKSKEYVPKGSEFVMNCDIENVDDNIEHLLNKMINDEKGIPFQDIQCLDDIVTELTQLDTELNAVEALESLVDDNVSSLNSSMATICDDGCSDIIIDDISIKVSVEEKFDVDNPIVATGGTCYSCLIQDDYLDLYSDFIKTNVTLNVDNVRQFILLLNKNHLTTKLVKLTICDKQLHLELDESGDQAKTIVAFLMALYTNKVSAVGCDAMEMTCESFSEYIESMCELVESYISEGTDLPDKFDVLKRGACYLRFVNQTVWKQVVREMNFDKVLNPDNFEKFFNLEIVKNNLTNGMLYVKYEPRHKILHLMPVDRGIKIDCGSLIKMLRDIWNVHNKNIPFTLNKQGRFELNYEFIKPLRLAFDQCKPIRGSDDMVLRDIELTCSNYNELKCFMRELVDIIVLHGSITTTLVDTMQENFSALDKYFDIYYTGNIKLLGAVNKVNSLRRNLTSLLNIILHDRKCFKHFTGNGYRSKAVKLGLLET